MSNASFGILENRRQSTEDKIDILALLASNWQ